MKVIVLMVIAFIPVLFAKLVGFSEGAGLFGAIIAASSYLLILGSK